MSVKLYKEGNVWTYNEGIDDDVDTTMPAGNYRCSIRGSEVSVRGVDNSFSLFTPIYIEVTDIQKSATPGDNYADIDDFEVATSALFAGNVSDIEPFTNRIAEYVKNTGSKEMNVDGSTTPVDFKYTIIEDVEAFERSIFSITGGSQDFTSTNFGNIATLTNGVLIIIKYLGVEYIQETWKTNLDIAETCYDFANPFKDGAYLGRWTFSKDTGAPIYLPVGSEIIVRIQDNLSSLTTFRFRIKGDKS